MNKPYLFFVTLVVLFIANSASATVGGPVYISSLVFNGQDNSIYYMINDYGGRGCPLIINKINLSTLKNSEIKSCDQVEKEFPYSEENIQKYNQFRENIFKNLPFVGSISLKKNNIDINVKFLSKHIENDSVSWSKFRATLFQDKKEIGQIDFNGCAKDQPHVFEGYIIPNSSSMALLISNIGDCFEGGYIKESLRVIKNVKFYDKNLIRGYKADSATELNSGNMVVYAENEEAPTLEPDALVNPSENKKNYTIFYIIVGGILTLGLGYILGKKTRI